MTVAVTGGDKSLDEVLASIREALRAERKRTKTERDAFGEFATRIADLSPSNQTSVYSMNPKNLQKASGTATLQSQPISEPNSTDELATIKKAYERTVMSVPFYEAEYGDTYQESIQAEFGPDVATALTEAGRLTPEAKEFLLSMIEQAQNQRTALIKTCEREQTSVEEVVDVLKPIDQELESVEDLSIEEQSFGSLEAQWTRLGTLKNKCEHAAAERQATIHRHRTEYNLPVEAPDICEYLYEEFETAYPILCLCSDLARRVDNRREKIEHAMSTDH